VKFNFFFNLQTAGMVPLLWRTSKRFLSISRALDHPLGQWRCWKTFVAESKE